MSIWKRPGGAETDSITEFGAVKVRGGEVQGEFQTLVNPRTHIPPLIAVLTGITNSMVANAPVLATVLPSFLSFAENTVIVAHNAPVRCGLPSAILRSAGISLTALAGDRHSGARPPNIAPGRSTQLPVGDPGPALSGDDDAKSPCPGGRAGHRGRASRSDRARGQSRRAHHRGPAGVRSSGISAAAREAHLGNGSAQ